jgi:ATP-dependent helicase Lhr and Lhr-like helicase
MPQNSTPLAAFHPAVRSWFEAVFDAPTRAQVLGWQAIAKGESSLLLAPTGSGKTLAAFLWCINRLMFSEVPPKQKRCRILYVSPIKALAVDIERNLRAPLVGIAQAAQRLGERFHAPTMSVRTGDTPSSERARFLRTPADILITTPESLYLLLTSNAREVLGSIEMVIIDEIHALVPTKRGSHLALSLERLELLAARKIQRIGLSATQRPLEEVARFLGGADSYAAPTSTSTESDQAEILSETEKPLNSVTYRPVTIVDASEPKRFDLKVEVPVEDMARLDEVEQIPSGPASKGPSRRSIWTAIHPKLLALVKAHRTTLIFVNSRRLAERISGAVNELAGEILVRAHHGSVAAEQRRDMEDRLKLGTLRGIVATSSLELGIDMGSIDLVVQIESPPSVASGMQRIGRASHNVGATSNAVIFPKFRADLISCAAITRAMYDAQVESVQYPRNPLDVLAQQIVAMVAVEHWSVDELFAVVRKAAPYATLPRGIFEGVLDMLSGLYPSSDFTELRARLTWDRVKNSLSTRQGAKHVAIANAGTIPDRGLYGVFLAGATKGARVGELDEEMIFESRQGDTIILGASTWRIEEITHNQVLVSPAPGEPGRMPFWKGDAPGRPYEFGEKIGKMVRELSALPRPVAFTKLVEEHSLDVNSAENLLSYLEEQKAATQNIPSDTDIVIETCHDELGDRRICILTPFGSRVHAPLCMAAMAKVREQYGVEIESMWSDDGFVLRLPENDLQIPWTDILPTAAELRPFVLQQLGGTSLFAAKFREAAGRALLLPRRKMGTRSPLWQQRKRAADLLTVAARFSSFPIILETYRECMREVFDLSAATGLLQKIEKGDIRVTTVDSAKPSPFAASLLFSYVANYIYEGDAPLAERRAQALSIDQSQLEQLLGDNDLRELLDAAVVDEVESRLQSLDPEFHARSTDAIHDLLLKLGDISRDDLRARSENPQIAATIDELLSVRRAVRVSISGEHRFIPVEYASRYRDALGTPLPPGLPEAFLHSSETPLHEILRRYSRTHGPFTTFDIAKRYHLPPAQVETLLHQMHGEGKLLSGEFRPGGTHQEWCDAEVLQQIRRKSLAKLRREVEPVEQHVFARFLNRWQGVTTKRKGPDALLDVIESLQGAALLASELEREILPARIAEYKPSDLDALMSAGEVVWTGVAPVGDRDGRVALYLTATLPNLWRREAAAAEPPAPESRENKILQFLQIAGASFYPAIHAAAGGGYPNDTLDALWKLVWSAQITNDTFYPLRQLLQPAKTRHDRSHGTTVRPGSPEYLMQMRSRSGSGPGGQGRWSLLQPAGLRAITPTEWSANTARQLFTRHGILMRETAAAEDLPGGFSAIYPALRTMEDNGSVRRGMFVAALGAAQFALPAAVDVLRNLRSSEEKPEAIFLAATDPANPYGAILPWPSPAIPENEDQITSSQITSSMSRSAGAGVILINGSLSAFLRRTNPSLRVFLPDSEPEQSQYARVLARGLAELAVKRQSRRSGLLISEINGQPAQEHLLAPFLEEAGFFHTIQGYHMRRIVPLTKNLPVDPNDPQAEEFEESA